MSRFVTCDQCGSDKYMNNAYCRKCERDLCEYCMEKVPCPDCQENNK